MSRATTEPPGGEALLLHTLPAFDLDRWQFFNFCQINKGRRIERAANGDIVIMAPTGGSTGSGNTRLNAALSAWAERDGTGTVFDSSTGFDLPNGATRSPDVSWVKNDRLGTLSPDEWHRFLPLCPDFVIELRSVTDRLEPLQEKLGEYLDNGARLGWLIDPETRSVTVYEAGRAPQRLENAGRVSGGDTLPGFELDLAPVWRAIFRES